MDTKTSTSSPAPGTAMRRRRRNGDDTGVRYFLPKADSSPTSPELGQEMASEGEALIEAFKNGQIFFTLTAWKAVPEVNGGSPVIVKQPLASKAIER